MTTKRSGTTQEMLLNKRNHLIWTTVVTPIAAAVVFVITYFLILPAITMSSQETHCGYEEHTHSPECYDEQGGLICGLEEHTHSLVCYSDYDAEIESADVWQQELPELTGDRREDVLAVAKSLMGYRESDKNYMVTDGDETKGYTRFGHWYGLKVDDILKETTDEVTAEVIREIDADLAADETGEKTQQFLQEVDDYLANAPAASDAQEDSANAPAASDAQDDQANAASDFDAADGQTYADDTANAPADYDAVDGQAYAPADYDAEENQAYADGTANAPASYDGAEDQTNMDGADAFANEEGSAPVQAEDLYALPDDLLNGIADFAAGNVTPERAAEIARFIGGLRANDITSRLPGKLSEKLVGVSADDIARGHSLKHDNGIPDYSYWDWDAMFASYVMSYSRAGDMGANTDAASWADALAAVGRYVDAPDYIPSEGDLVFFAPYADEPAVVGIVSDINKSFFGLGKVNSISVICGDFDNEVSEIRIAMEEYKEGDLSAEIIQGYGLLNVDDPSENPGDDASGTDSSLDKRGDLQDQVPADTHVSDEAAIAAGDESFADRMDESGDLDLSNPGKPDGKKSSDSSDASLSIPNDMACTMLPGETRTLTANGSDYTVTMTYGAESEIP
ncbi:MAG: hypothetical protein Q4A32_12185, partial [Lachnospiraceae bacterium]|nr:hypothetical protein [Lachnospiraceae bacterium]